MRYDAACVWRMRLHRLILLLKPSTIPLLQGPRIPSAKLTSSGIPLVSAACSNADKALSWWGMIIVRN